MATSATYWQERESYWLKHGTLPPKAKKGRGQRKNKRDVEGRRRNALKVLLDKKLC